MVSGLTNKRPACQKKDSMTPLVSESTQEGPVKDCADTRTITIVVTSTAGCVPEITELPEILNEQLRTDRNTYNEANSSPTLLASTESRSDLATVVPVLESSSSRKGDCDDLTVSFETVTEALSEPYVYPEATDPSTRDDFPSSRLREELDRQLPASPDRSLTNERHADICASLGTPLAKPKLTFCVDEVDDEHFPLTRLENVTAHQRSLIPIELLRPPRRPKKRHQHSSKLQIKMAETKSASQTTVKNKRRKSIFGRKIKKVEKNGDSDPSYPPVKNSQLPGASKGKKESKGKKDAKKERQASRGRGRVTDTDESHNLRPNSIENIPSKDTTDTQVKSNTSGKPPRPNIVERIRSRSQSISRSRKLQAESSDVKPILVAVTSCRSDAYYNQKAPGSTAKIPRKAPTNLKTFHELAVAVKDAYQAGGETPTRPEGNEENQQKNIEAELDGRMVLWEFMGNLDFLLALVDEVAIDTVTRGALKDDSTFKSLRDVIKKCNKILEGMLIRRERKVTLFIRLVQPLDQKQIHSMKLWNAKVEKAVGAVAEDSESNNSTTQSESETDSTMSASTIASGDSRRSGIFTRGRQLLPAAGRVRARRATPAPALRKKRGKRAADQPNSVAAEDGYSTSVTAPVTHGNLAMLQRSLATNDPESKNTKGLKVAEAAPKKQLATVKAMQPKDELVDVIRGLRMEKMNRTKNGTAETELANLKPNWQPKADIPMTVPKLPNEYIHRHRLMKQVVNCLLEKSGAGPRDTDDEVATSNFITSITSRHVDKAGNGKTILAAAAIQSVEIRERFKDGIAWIQLGRTPLSEKDVRRLYEELHRQLFSQDSDLDDDDSINSSKSSKDNNTKSERMSSSRQSSFESLDKLDEKDTNSVRYSLFSQIAQKRQRFEGGDLEGIKEDIGRKLAGKNILICLDDVWRVEDAKWFVFEKRNEEKSEERRPRAAIDPHPYRVLLTTRTPGLLGAGAVQEVFVRIFSEAEAVKLLLSSTGRRPYGGKNSTVFNQARVIVKGCGNSPLAVLLASGMLRRSNRNWNLNSPTWTALMKQCKVNLDEASRLRSFVNSATRVVDLSFVTVEDLTTRAALRRCVVTFAMAFRDNDWVMIGRGIPQAAVLKLFGTVISTGQGTHQISPESILEMLQTMHLLQTARHGCHMLKARVDEDAVGSLSENGGDEVTIDESTHRFERPSSAFVHETPSFVMQDSIKAIAEEMATRSSSSFLPVPDSYTSFSDEIEAEKTMATSGRMWSAPLRYLAQSLSSNKTNQAMEQDKIHELVVASLMAIDSTSVHTRIVESFKSSRSSTLALEGGDKMEEYMGAFLPTHLIRAHAYVSAGDLLVDPHFIGRRVASLGAVESTRRQVADIISLRREYGKAPKATSSTTPDSPDQIHSPSYDDLDEERHKVDMDMNAVARDGSRRIIDEIYRVVNFSATSSDSLTMAICLSSVGEGLLKCRQPRDAMLRLEEAVGIYRGLLGPNHIEVAWALHSVAKALMKQGETRLALQKFAEAGRIYETCNATLHFDSIANVQFMASLYVEVGEWAQAGSKFEDVITMKKSVYGKDSVPVAKSINSYAIILAKHGRMNNALAHYEDAKATYGLVAPSAVSHPEFELKCKYDVTLINLNIASIKSKKGDLQGAINSYKEGVRGLREHEEALELLGNSVLDTEKSALSHNKHLVAALGRIGSLKLKLGDTEGALAMYIGLLQEVDESSPVASRIEKAKAHIKIATIYRQQVGREPHIQSIAHLRQALGMYTKLFGPDHKDTHAISSSLQQWLSEES